MSDMQKPREALNFFLDTEFNDEVGDCRIEPISIGIVSEGGAREFYAESRDFNEGAAHPWLREHVLPKLGPRAQRVSLQTMREGVRDYFAQAVKAGEGVDRVRIWYKNGALDQAVIAVMFDGLSKFYAAMNDLGARRSYFNDTDALREQLEEKISVPRPESRLLHHALHDARHERAEYLAIMQALAAARIENAVKAICAL